MVPKDYDDRHPEIDREYSKQKAIARYRYIKRLKESKRNLDDKLFLENFETAMCYLWGFQSATGTSSVDTIPVPTKSDQAS